MGACEHKPQPNDINSCGEKAGRKKIAGEKVARKKVGRNYSGPWRKTPGRVIGIGLIRLYQLTLSSIIGNSCRHQPTCSEYSYEAVARHGLIAGSWLTLFRVGKCNPFGTSGYDPVPKTMVWGKKASSNQD